MLICRGLKSGSSVSIAPISHQQCYLSWAGSWIRLAVWQHPLAGVPLSKEWIGQGMCPRLITFIWVQGATLLFHNRWSRAARVTLFPMGRGRRTSGAQLHRGYVPTPGPTAFKTEGAQNIQSAASFTGGARNLSGAEVSARHSQPSYPPAATRRRPDGGCGFPVY